MVANQRCSYSFRMNKASAGIGCSRSVRGNMAEAVEGLCGGAEKVEGKHELYFMRKNHHIRPNVPLLSLGPAFLIRGAV